MRVSTAAVAPPPGSDAPAGPNVPQVSPQLIGLAVVLGIVGAVAASLFLEGIAEELEELSQIMVAISEEAQRSLGSNMGSSFTVTFKEHLGQDEVFVVQRATP